MPAWKKHYLAWAPKATVELKYDSMRSDTAKEISRVFNELGYKELLPFVSEAVEMANIENMKKSEKLGVRNPERFKENFGSIGGGDSDQSTLSDSDVQYIRSPTEEIDY